jgi:GNAT superfamily N-acetyltransferase
MAAPARHGELVIREVGPASAPDFLSFFDHDAFADDPSWGGCYCRYPQANHAGGAWDLDDGEHNRAAVAELIEQGSMRGHLAYLDGRPVAWCNANRRAAYTIFDPDDHDPGSVGAIACFVVAQPYRGQGIARRLLDAACEGLRRDGVTVVEAYPRSGAATAADNHLGPLSMYLSAGFKAVGEDGASTIVRKQLR